MRAGAKVTDCSHRWWDSRNSSLRKRNSIAKIFEAQGQGKFLGPHRRHHALQFVPAFASHANLLVLNLSRHFEFAVTNESRDLLGHGRFNALLDFDRLPRMP